MLEFEQHAQHIAGVLLDQLQQWLQSQDEPLGGVPTLTSSYNMQGLHDRVLVSFQQITSVGRHEGPTKAF